MKASASKKIQKLNNATTYEVHGGGTMVIMYKLFGLIFFIPLLTFAYTSVIAQPQNAAVVLPLSVPQKPQEFYGRLDDFPHTFEFVVSEKFNFSASVFVPNLDAQKNDASLIVIKEERRGVSEVGRTDRTKASWEVARDSLLAFSFRNGGMIESTLEPGVYRIEVSSPDNDATYRLVIGTEKISRGYVENVRVLLEVRSFLGAPLFTLFASPLIYLPFVFITLFCVLLWMYLKRRSLM